MYQKEINLISSFQKPESQPGGQHCSDVADNKLLSFNCIQKSHLQSDKNDLMCVSDSLLSPKKAPDLPDSYPSSDNIPAGTKVVHPSSNLSFTALLARLSTSTFAWKNLHKSSSPKLKCSYNGMQFSALVDSGAEVNVFDRDFAVSLKIPIIASTISAQAANKVPLDVYGQSSQPVSVKCVTESGHIMLHLGIVLIVTNLGANCLLGEPAKECNNIICLPRHKLILIANGNEVQYAKYDSDESKYQLVRAVSDVKLNPGEQLKYKLPEEFLSESCVAVTPRQLTLDWLKPSLVPVLDNAVYLTNTSSTPVTIQKHSHLADIRSTVIVDAPQSPLPRHATHEDGFQYENLAKTMDFKQEYLSQLQVDPDLQLTPENRDIFNKIHIRFQKLFTPQPGKYNGNRGYIDNKLKFASPPPPNTRTHIPNYSPAMNSILAQKMDLLESWGVLVEPERIGVSVEYVSPSLLVPKPDSGEYRLVTDFSSLNLHLKKVPNTSATIAQARKRIARAHFVIHMDLANFFYQNGLQKCDLKFLGTIHPYKGLRIYTCDPQGLKGASERSYEKLVRIYGDMVQNGQLAQMADGLHVLGDSINQLADNYIEVLSRAEACGLTFKPSKTIVCPKNIKLFGWELKGNVWHPTPHTISALTNAPTPTTVKKLRSFLGSFKQLSASLPNYAAVVHALEQVVGGKASSERLVWTSELQEAFTKAKELAAHPQGIAEPRPDDKLTTFSDYSAESRAVGGRLLITRKNPDGTTHELVGGFFSAVLDRHKQHWLPCEGEACAIRLVL